MTKQFLIFLFFINVFNSLNAQTLGSATLSNGGLITNKSSSQPLTNLKLLEISVGNNNAGAYIGETIGSPYENETFEKAKIYYGDEYEGELYIRYNAMLSMIEVKNTLLPEEEPKQLLADKNLIIKLPEKELLFSTFVNKKGETLNGYLSKIGDGESYQLYSRLAVKYSEGQAAANSMLNPKPARYVHFYEYYMMTPEKKTIDEIKTSNKKFLKQLSTVNEVDIKANMKTEKIDLKTETDLMRLFEYLNSL